MPLPADLQPDALFFDLDGTLTDPKEGITRSVQYALEKMAVPVPHMDDLEWCIGPPLRQNFVTLVGEARADEGVAFYRERFADIGWAENQPYPGIATTLTTLRKKHVPLYVATSKPHVFAERILKHFELHHHFVHIYGSELDGTNADKSELLKFALNETGRPASAVMIGDRSHDVVGALNNGLHSVGVTYGYGSEAELQGAGAHCIVHTPQAVSELF